MKTIYLDNAATTPLLPEVLETMLPYMTEQFGNPSSQYSLGRQTRSAIEEARKNVAKLIHAHPGEIFFTSGGTESNNTAIKCSVRDLGVRRIITSPIEHHCVLHTVEDVEHQGVEVVYLPVDQEGKISLSSLRQLLSDTSKKTLVSLMHANNEIGTLIDLKQIGDLCKEFGALFHSDTVPTFGHLPLNVQEMQVDFLSAAGHKFHGPKGVGLLYVRKGIGIKSFMHGGGQERNFRAGTENVYGIVGFSKAASIAYQNIDNDILYTTKLKNYFIEKLRQIHPDIQFNGPTDENALYTILNVSFPKVGDAAMILFALDLEGICVSGGSACSSGANAGSHVIQALRKESDAVNIRFSFSKLNTIEELDIVINKLREKFVE
ncbi:MAG: cysteine desulfurase [Chitinophagales bacterium]|nr:cysteine desulfurase [Chitinophagales bacterium]